jgi:5-methylcytosine-specific restriction endonuclease McrA
MHRTCRKCGTTHPLDDKHFGHTPSGNFRWTCRSCVRAIVRGHSASNPQMVRARSQRRANHERAASGYLAEGEHRAIRAAYKSQCYFCGSATTSSASEIDHLTPISRGGTHWRENRALVCKPCNQAKRDKTAHEFLQWRGARGLQIAPWHIRKLIPPFEGMAMKIDDLGFSLRTQNCLGHAGIIYLGDLVEYFEQELAGLPNFGRKCLNEVIARLKNLNVGLGSQVREWNSHRPGD